MKYSPFIALIMAASVATSASAAGTDVQNVGQSQKPAQDVATCIAKTWADKAQQQVVTQEVLANGLAADVYVPGQQPPNGAAAVVRPAPSGNAKTWVGFRAGSGAAGGAAASDINSCL